MTPWDSQHWHIWAKLDHSSTMLLFEDSSPNVVLPSLATTVSDKCCRLVPFGVSHVVLRHQLPTPGQTTAALSIVRVPRAWNPGWFMTASLYHGPWFKLRGDQVAMARESMRIQEMAIFHLANSSVFARAQTIFCCKPKANLGDGFKNVFIFI